MSTSSKLFTIGQLARRTGMPAPAIRNRPATIWTAPLSRTASSVLAGTAGIRSASGRTTGSARGATRSGLRKVS